MLNAEQFARQYGRLAELADVSPVSHQMVVNAIDTVNRTMTTANEKEAALEIIVTAMFKGHGWNK